MSQLLKIFKMCTLYESNITLMSLINVHKFDFIKESSLYGYALIEDLHAYLFLILMTLENFHTVKVEKNHEF